MSVAILARLQVICLPVASLLAARHDSGEAEEQQSSVRGQVKGHATGVHATKALFGVAGKFATATTASQEAMSQRGWLRHWPERGL